MTQDYSDIDRLFEGFDPQVSDSRTFMEQLSHRLDAVEHVRHMQEVQLRRLHRAAVVSFACGAVLGGVCLALVLLWPAGSPLFTLHIPFVPLVMLGQYGRVALLLLLTAIVTSGVVVTQYLQGSNR